MEYQSTCLAHSGRCTIKIIAFGHRKEVGKDTASKYLITELRIRRPGISVRMVGFADKVKDVAFQLFGWAGLMPGDFYEEPQNLHLKEVILPKLGKTPRQLWIGVGNGIRAATGYDGTWLDYVFNHVKCDVMVIKDMRFPTEAEGVKRAGGWVYKINCPWAPVVADGADDPLENYQGWTGEIDNDRHGDFRHLHGQVIAILDRHFI